MATRNLVPRATNEGSIGTDAKQWNELNVNKAFASNNILVFVNVADMKASNKVKVGYTLKTLGYYSPNDGGGAEYVVVDDIGDDEPDDGSIIQLQKNLYAKFILNTKIDVRCFGAKFDNETDDTNCIQKIFDFCTNGTTIIFPAFKRAIITNTLQLPIGVSIEANKSFLVIKANKSIWAIEYAKKNISPDNDTTGNRGFSFKSYIKDLGIEGNVEYINNGIDINNNITIINLTTSRLNTSIRKTTGYSDFVQIKGCAISLKAGEDYAIKLNALGDGNVIRDVHLFNYTNNLNCIEIGYGLQPVLVENVINGNIYVHHCLARIEKIHLEKGCIIIGEGALCNINTAHIWKQPNTPAIDIQNKITGLSLEDIYVIYSSQKDYKNDNGIDIKFNSYRFSYYMKNCFRYLEGINVGTLFIYGIKTNRDEFNRDRTRLSKLSINSGCLCSSPLSTVDINMPYIILSGTVFKDPNFVWQSDLTSVSYEGVCLLDEERKLAILNKKGTVPTTSVEKGEKSIILQLNTYFNSPILLVRNGTQKVVVAPVQDSILDTGFMCGGDVWEDYSSSISTDYQDCYGIERNPQRNRDNIVAYMNAIPTKGTWVAGDIVKKYNPSSGQAFSWICVSGGAPGTWKELTTVQE